MLKITKIKMASYTSIQRMRSTIVLLSRYSVAWYRALKMVLDMAV